MIGVLSRGLSLQEFVVFVNFITLLNESDSQSVYLCQNLVTAAYFQMGWLSYIYHRIYARFTHTFSSLFVFLKSDPKQNARSLLTPVSDPAFQALSHGSHGFALHGSFFNHFFIGQNCSTANENL